ncbi:MAG: hypothetical protein QGG58_00770 [Chloroflexota bacterium]|nr:hypothetical protein [Chloroflexota bacterium]
MTNDAEISEVQRRGREIVATVERTFRDQGANERVIEPLVSVLQDQIEALVGAARNEGEAFGRRAGDWELTRLVNLELGLYLTPDGAWEYSLGGYFSESFDTSRDALREALERWRGEDGSGGDVRKSPW